MNINQYFNNIQHYFNNLNFERTYQLVYHNKSNNLYCYILLEQNKILVYQGNTFLGETKIDVKDLELFFISEKLYFEVREPEINLYISSTDLFGSTGRGQKTKVAPDYDKKIDKGNTIYVRKRKDI